MTVKQWLRAPYHIYRAVQGRWDTHMLYLPSEVVARIKAAAIGGSCVRPTVAWANCWLGACSPGDNCCLLPTRLQRAARIAACHCCTLLLPRSWRRRLSAEHQ